MRFLALQSGMAGVLVAAWIAGWLGPVFAADVTHITKLIALMFVIGLVQGYRGKWEDADRIGGWLILLGLLGTVIGLSIAIGGAEGQDFTLRDLGASSALNTTICGIIGALWLDICRRLTGDEA